jgi:hypothetical protein
MLSSSPWGLGFLAFKIAFVEANLHRLIIDEAWASVASPGRKLRRDAAGSAAMAAERRARSFTFRAFVIRRKVSEQARTGQSHGRRRRRCSFDDGLDSGRKEKASAA